MMRDGVVGRQRFGAPVRRNQRGCARAGADAMENDLGRRAANHLGRSFDILFQRKQCHFAALVFCRQLAAAHDHQRMQFKPLNAFVQDAFEADQAVFRAFSGQPDDQVRTHRNRTRLCPRYRFSVCLESVAAMDTIERFVKSALQPEFEPDFGALFLVSGQEIENGIRDAIRPGPDAQADDIARSQRGVVQRA